MNLVRILTNRNHRLGAHKNVRSTSKAPADSQCGTDVGFTATELLVVLGIIITLSSLLLLPVVKAKSRVNATACVSNLRQVGIVIAMYVSDFNQYPNETDWAATAFPEYANQKLLPNAAENTRVFVCPAKPVDKGKFSRFGYGYNGLGAGHFEGPNLGLGHIGMDNVRESQVKVPTEMIMIGDSGSSVWSDWLLNPNMDLGHNNIPQPVLSLPSERHNGGANIIFCDGHVEYAKQKRWIERTNRARRRWNNDYEPHPEAW